MPYNITRYNTTQPDTADYDICVCYRSAPQEEDERAPSYEEDFERQARP